jgi:ferrochelatase
VLVLPLHPQYCASTVASAFDGVALAWARMRRLPEQRLVNGYYDHPGYIRALAASVRDHWSRAGGQRHLLMSYHSIPLAYARRGDPYPEHVRETSGLLARELGLGSGEWSLGFQSRVLGGRWLEPATEAVLTSLAAGGVRRVSVISPVFPTDCLETLDDLVVQARIQFIRNGGDELDVVPALNDRDDHLDFLACLAEERCAGWFGPARGDGRASVVPLARRS